MVYSGKFYKKMDDLGVPLGVDAILTALFFVVLAVHVISNCSWVF
jgi:hypothetical protein